jgi:hypothetical protein
MAAHRDADADVRLALTEHATPRRVANIVTEFMEANQGLLEHFDVYSAQVLRLHA